MNELKKGDVFEMNVSAISSDGSGIGRVNGKVVFVPFTAIGDCIEAAAVKTAKSFIRGELARIITPSPDRIPVDCGLAGECGGCDFRHISYEAELAAKQEFVRDAFTRIGKLNPQFSPIIPSDTTEHYRNNVQLHLGKDVSGGIVYGFRAAKSDTVVPHKRCKLYPGAFNEIMDGAVAKLRELRGKNAIAGQICVRRGHYSGEICAGFKSARDGGYTALIGGDTISDTMCGIEVAVSLLSFYQVNTPAAEKLYGVIADMARPNGAVVLDLYCGIGVIGLSLARRAKEVVGIERVKSAVENASANAKRNGIGNARFIHGDAADLPDNIKPDVVVLDPPRKGCDLSATEKAAALRPSRIVTVSCAPATAARDCARLEQRGYKTVGVAAVDLFPRTRHVECAALLEYIGDK